MRKSSGKTVSGILKAGDVIYVAPQDNFTKEDENSNDIKTDPARSNSWRLRADPEGRRRAGRDGPAYRPRARDGRRLLLRREPVQPRDAGDAPARLVVQAFVYAAALDNGYTPSSVVIDAPIEIDQGPGMRPVAAGELRAASSAGPSTLRTGIEQSRNVMTVRLAQDIGMPLVVEYAARFGVYDDLPPYLSDGARRRRDHACSG